MDAGQFDPVVTPSRRAEFGDYQVNGAMGAAKRLREPPFAFAQKVVQRADLADLASHIDVAGPGFINITLRDEFVLGAIRHAATVEQPPPAETIVVDYASPNLAKEMHVGHLRSTVIGDAAARTLEHLGHRVIRQNHVGDWGTPFGRLVTHIREEAPDQASEESPDLGNMQLLVAHYVRASERFTESPAFAAQAREAVVQLQRGDPQTRALWNVVREASLDSMRSLFHRLDLSLTDADIRGESSYSDDLPRVVDALKVKNLIAVSDGALCVFVEGFARKDGSPLPMLVQKSDGGYLYHTTDLAALRHRCSELRADRILYFTDFRQKQHFQMLFAVARKAEFVPAECRLEHHAFGTVVNRQGEPFNSRKGEVVRLEELLDKGVERARAVLAQKSSGLPPSEVEHVVKTVAVGAIKYADLSKNLTQDYVFDWDSMLALEGNTAPYLLYAYARIRSVLAKTELAPEDLETIGGGLWRWVGAERQLAVELLRFQEVVEQVCEDVRPHFLCSYLYELTSKFMRFYEQCPILDAPPGFREGRLALCGATAQVLKTGLSCLGISTVARM